jgi:multidrug efflux pump subunit AcrA (membrane-fusion protein)
MYNDSLTYGARVIEIDPRVKSDGYVSVKLEIDGNQSFLAGMSVKATINVSHNKSMIIPKNAVVKKSGRSVVFTVQDQKAKWNYVTIGKENSDYVEILEGLKSGSKVIVTNNLQLAHDTPVKISKQGL